MPSPLSTSPHLDLNASIFHDLIHLSRNQPHLLDRLYTSPHAVQCVFRALPPLARLYLTRVMHTSSHEPVSIADFRHCLRRRQRAYDRHDAALRALKAMRVVVEPPINVDNPMTDGRLPLNHTFLMNLRSLVTYDVNPVFDGGVEEGQPVSDQLMDSLNRFAAAKLERVLNYLVEANGMSEPGGGIVGALLYGGILEERREGLCITSVGFQFLLKDSYSQMWALVRAMLRSRFEGREIDMVEVLFRLRFAGVGRGYAMSSIDGGERELIHELHELGVVKMETIGGGIDGFRVTPIGGRMLGMAGREGKAGDGSGIARTAGEIEIFVETNFRVYAYTNSNFQTNLLGLFTHLRYRLPSMVVGHLTRDSVRRALMNGITGDQIIGYLNAHAHPRMKRGAIPSNVSDEIRLWEAEQDRVQTRPGVLLSDFQSQANFHQVLEYSNDLGATLWSNIHRLQLVVEGLSYERVKAFVKKNGLQ